MVFWFSSVAPYQYFGEICYLFRSEEGGSELFRSVRTFNFDTVSYLYDCNHYELPR